MPTRGMERWLTQRMSDRLGATPGRSDGVCANVDFPSPRGLVGEAIAAASGIGPDEDAWLPERAVWPLLEVVDACLSEPWMRILAAHLEGEAAGARRLSSVRHLADLFDRYALNRPEMVRSWAGGVDTDLPQDAVWQAELWRRLRDRISQPDPAARLEHTRIRLLDEPRLVGLPPRVSLFGLTRLPRGHLDVLRALAVGRDVHLFLLHPSARLWERVAGVMAQSPPGVRRREDPTSDLPDSRLLASWGQDARELQLVVGAPDHDHHHPVEHGQSTLLDFIQADVRSDRPPPGLPLPGSADARPVLHPGDRSLQVHSCHGRARQVEVVRDAILHELEDDSSLEPRDVIVMCPDIETFAPLIHATFGAGETFDSEDEEIDALPADLRPPDLRVRLADRSLRQTNPVLGVVSRLSELAEQRLTASQVLDLAAREPVRRRFGFDDDDLARMEDWVADSGIRWGLDAAHRAPFELGALPAGTWRAGLDRVLVGVTMTEDEQRLFGGVLPLHDVESGSIDLAGRFAEFVDRLQASLDALSDPKPIGAWAEAITDAANALTAAAQRDAWQRSELQRILNDLVTEAGAHTVTLSLPEVRALLAERLQGRPTRANFRTGHLTICTLVPMRSVPHRIVCLLGLDDAVFPRKAPRDGDDLMLGDPHVGDRDSRTEDRQMLLDALLAATDKLIITYTGNDERTNVLRPPAVPVGELLEAVDRTVRTDDDSRARDRVVTGHPLQPFDPRNFTVGALVRERAWSFDRITLEGAQALHRERMETGPFLAGPLPDAGSGEFLSVEDLVRFAEHPVRAFLRRRLGISVRLFSEEVADGLPVDLDGLGRWGVGQRLLEARLAGVESRVAALAEIARGTLPPGALGKPVIEAVLPIVEDIVLQAEALVPPTVQTASIDIRVTLPDGRRITGTVPGVAGDVLRTVAYSRVGPKHRLAAWVRLLALTAAQPERPFEAATIGRAGGSAQVTVARIRPLAPDEDTRRELAFEHLATIVDLHDRGMREPLPLYCAASAAYVKAADAGQDPVAAGCNAWESDFGFDKEDREPEHQLVLGAVRTFADVLAEVPRPGEDGVGWASAEKTRFGRFARRLWDGVSDFEALADR